MNPKKPNNNTIYNNYFDNTYKTFDGNAFDSGNNTWNITKIRGTNIVGGPYLGGNYWCDYNGTETSGDKLGDTLLPYNCSDHIKNGGDYHPLIKIPKIILKASKDGYGLTLI
jgi:nitrous oxidase accessory protein NosD